MSIRSHTDCRRLDQRIIFQRKTLTQAGNGDLSDSWVTLKTCWAGVDAEKVLERHKEPVHGEAVRTYSNYTIWVRAELIDRLVITSLDRIVWKGVILDILDTRHQQKRGRLTPIFARSGASLG